MVAGPAECLVQNLVATYAALAKAVPGAEYHQHDGYDCCIGPFKHPLVNFAVCHEPDKEVLQAISRFSGRAAFNLYVSLSPYAQLECDPEVLGFVRSYELVQMSALGGTGVPDDSIVAAKSAVERQHLARFMTRQFFTMQSGGVRDRIASATASAHALELYGLRSPDGATLAGAMLHRTPGVTGLYNLCVEAHLRDHGFGSRMLEWVLGREERVVLQCEPSLREWYGEFGFRETGRVVVFAASRKSVDIM